MSARFLSRVGGLSIAILLVLSAAQAAEADTFIGGTNAWTMVGTPTFLSADQPVGATTWTNHLGVGVTAIVIMVVRNSANQTVYYSTGTVTIATTAIGSSYDIEFGLPNGAYTATFFAFTFAGVAISAPTSASFTVPIP